MIGRLPRVRALRWTTVLALVQLACGCGAVPETAPETSASEAYTRVWPDLPQPARIQYLTMIAGTRDLRRPPSFTGRLGQWVFGIADDRLVRPVGVAVQNQLIAVADAGAPALFLFDRGTGRVRRINELDGESLMSPVGVSIDAAGDVYLTDSLLRKVFVVSTQGRLRRTLALEVFRRPSSSAFDQRQERLYVADSAAHQVHVLSASGALLFSFGARGTSAGQFNAPSHIWVDASSRVYVVDALNFRLQVFDAEGRLLSLFGHHGDGSGDFARPKGVAVDSEGHVYVVDALFDSVQIFRSDGSFLLSFGDNGEGPGQFWLPGGIAIDEGDRIYIADSYNRRIQVFQYLNNIDHGAAAGAP